MTDIDYSLRIKIEPWQSGLRGEHFIICAYPKGSVWVSHIFNKKEGFVSIENENSNDRNENMVFETEREASDCLKAYQRKIKLKKYVKIGDTKHDNKASSRKFNKFFY